MAKIFLVFLPAFLAIMAVVSAPAPSDAGDAGNDEDVTFNRLDANIFFFGGLS
ncbi:hypothetical protein EUX98_g1889 [Antrodiella citrinella]|uniref:Uncharacterized protein n=1 Tax=Antrodiella citrinella TaxID=2447956 RepID=A0A4S4N097_9APHY|nr:hypothetical protein EUX98_g1889 [Antrodiella citrinella]